MSVISSRDEYLFIDPVDLPEDSSTHGKAPGNILYGGDIMPLRPESDKTLRGIDPLFIVNRVNMMHSLYEGLLVRGSFFRRVDYRNLLRARKSVVDFYTTGEYYTSGYGGLCGFPEAGIYEVDWSSADVFAQIPGALANIEWKSDAAAFANGAPLRRADVLDLFDDCNQNHICVKAGSRHEYKTTKFAHSFQGSSHEDDPGPVSTPSDTVYYYDAESTTETTDFFFEHEDEASECAVTFSIRDVNTSDDTPKLPSAAFPSVVRNVVYFWASMSYYPGEEMPTRYYDSYYALVSDASASDGIYSTPIQDVKRVVAKAKQDFGFNKINLHSGRGERMSMRVIYEGMNSIIEVPPQYDWKR